MRKFIALNVVLVFVLGCVATAQQMGPPKILHISREQVKAGKAVAHEKYEASWTQANLKAKNSRPYLGMTSMDGNEAWWLTGFDSFADFEKDRNNPSTIAIETQFSTGDAEYVSATHDVIARYRDDLSFGIEPLGAAHGFTVRTVRVRPGHNGEYEEIRKTVKQAVESANVNRVHSVVFQVVAGAPTGTYLVFTPYTSLAERDTPNEAMSAAMRDVGSKINDLASKSMISSEDQIFTFNPKFSNPSPDMVKAAPDFWKPKAAMAKASDMGAKTATTAKAPDKSKTKTGQ
jgi:hypothetical protein